MVIMAMAHADDDNNDGDDHHNGDGSGGGGGNDSQFSYHLFAPPLSPFPTPSPRGVLPKRPTINGINKKKKKKS